jgi:periplasmic protein TonB
MDSPRAGFRRATATSWALVGIGIAGVAGASTLAYADTVKPPVAYVPDDSAAPGGELVPTPAENLPPVPDVATMVVDPPAPPVTTQPPVPQVTPENTVDQAPVRTYEPVPANTPEQTVEQAPAPVTHQAPIPKVSSPPTTQRRLSTPTTVNSPNYSRPVTRSRGS